ncbi:hypothetical protein NP493_342g00020 [Ridgeia piscesae]|uniref:Large ribosomal subunit protein bL27m n=1 Tax=Ridgeia piscesae TaxID=27915 RepID=A0AAD9NVL4_RIDPI|nr:hypothetical protein NP493_342g00020 [Ridgeia piscesae]
MFFPENPCNQTVRWASKKASGSTRNKRKSTPGKARGWKKNEGDHVEKGMILFRQLGLKVYPGENVGCGKDLTLFALEQGRVIVTVEKLSPYPNSPLYPAVKAGRVVLRKFYHVIPEPQRETFKLVSQI